VRQLCGSASLWDTGGLLLSAFQHGQYGFAGVAPD